MADMTRKTTVELDAASLTQRLMDAAERFRGILRDAEGDAASERISAFEEEWSRNLSDTVLRLAFVGQYNAGKSTTISALTGRDDLLIDSDIATGATAEFEWNGIKVIDTPGIWTERTDHDAITLSTLRQADLLVYTLTYMLFDSVTSRNFKKLAFDEGYQAKIMILVNKANDEAGDYAQRVANYRQSLQDALQPHSLDAFRCCFVDARDYLDGVEEDDDELVAESHFPEFIEAMNDFVAARGALGRMDTPARILLGHMETAELHYAAKAGQPAVYLETLNRLSQRVRNGCIRLRRNVDVILSDVECQIARVGDDMASYVGDDNAPADAQAQVNAKVESICREAQEHISCEVSGAIEQLQVEFADILEGELVADYFGIAEVPTAPRGNGAPPVVDIEHRRAQWDLLKGIAEKAGLKVSAMAGGAKAGGSFLLKATQVSGSDMHKMVYGVGKLFGVKFKPWQAVNLAGKIGNVAKFVGPAASVLGIIFDLYQIHKESEQTDALRGAKRDVRSQFISIGDDITKAMRKQLRKVEVESFDVIEKDIDIKREFHRSQLDLSNNSCLQLSAIRSDVNALIAELQAD